jgi:tRNA A37 threonylcarbamoyladenosine modification protein TsaB
MQLFLHTATSPLSLTVSTKGGPSITKRWSRHENHAPFSELVKGFESACQEINKSPQTLETALLSLGPGSFTGIRLGIAFVRGLRLALPALKTFGIPLIDILDGRYAQTQKASEAICIPSYDGCVWLYQKKTSSTWNVEKHSLKTLSQLVEKRSLPKLIFLDPQIPKLTKIDKKIEVLIFEHEISEVLQKMMQKEGRQLIDKLSKSLSPLYSPGT